MKIYELFYVDATNYEIGTDYIHIAFYSTYELAEKRKKEKELKYEISQYRYYAIKEISIITE